MSDSNQILDALSAPLGDLLASVGRGVAEAQRAMDDATLDHIREIYDISNGDAQILREIGYQPTWYQIPEAEAEISIALTIHGDSSTSGSTKSGSGRKGLQLLAATTDATYTSRYNYDLSASSRLKFRIVPVPPPSPAAALRVVPLLVGSGTDTPALSYADATALLDRLGISWTVDPVPASTALVKSQDPAAGSLLAQGSVILKFS